MNFFNSLLQKIKMRKVKIGVIGQGYVGLPLAVCFAKNGFSVTGLDLDKEKVRAINKGENYLSEMGIEEDFQKVIKKGLLKATNNIIGGCRSQDVIIICVPTPVDENHRPEISFLKKAASDIGDSSPLGKLIVNESTVAPSTTTSLVGKIIEKKSRLRVGEEFFLGCSPERVSPGDLTHQVENTAKIIAGLGKKDLTLVWELYRQVIKAKLIRVSKLEVAETAKLLENSYRAVNIALVNELAKFCQKLDLDILEIIEAAKSKWTFQPHYPGIGVGGHCIPVDPWYLLQTAAGQKTAMPVLRKALAENEGMPRFVLENFLKEYQPGKTVLVYGFSFKAGVKDIRESPALEFCRLLKERKIKFEVYDPFYNQKEIKKFGLTPCLRFKKFDFLIVGTDHPELEKDVCRIVSQKTIIIDGRNFFAQKLGQKVIGVGRRLE